MKLSTAIFGCTAASSGLALLAAPAALLALIAATSGVTAQSYQTHNLTPDYYYHNRYHAILSMAVYGDYNTLCPNQTFTRAEELKNFPNATRPPWDVVSTFGPTASGASGFTAVISEMNKALIVFRGNYSIEQTLSPKVVSWESAGLGSNCPNCTVNAFAAQGYMEAKNATNNWADIKKAYAGQGLVFSITGHGLGGMHSQIAGVDLNNNNTDYYNHAYGSPKVFNKAGAKYFNDRFNGEAGERGVANDDQYTEYFPDSVNYTHAGTPFYYHGHNASAGGNPYVTICWLEDSPDYSACKPRPQNDTGNATIAQQHYFYWTNVGQCGGNTTANATLIAQFIANQTLAMNATSNATASGAASSGAVSATRVAGSATDSGAFFAPSSTAVAMLLASPVAQVAQSFATTLASPSALALLLGTILIGTALAMHL